VKQVTPGLSCEGKETILHVFVRLDRPVTQDVGDRAPVLDKAPADK
jgi:hypothetical protein